MTNTREYPATEGHHKDEIQLPTIEGIEFVNYVDEEQLDDVMRLVGQDLSEPYSSEFFGLCHVAATLLSNK